MVSIGVALLVALSAVSVGTPAQESQGVTDKEILIGSCSALTGPSNFLGTQTITGANAYFKMINEAGGVYGRQLRLVGYDDSYDPDKTGPCFEHLMRDKVFALGFFVGTPTAVKYMPMLENEKIPVVGLFTGAKTLYDPVRHYVLAVRASYADETREQMTALWNELHYRRIGVIHTNDAFGATVLEGVQSALKTLGSEPVAVASYPRQTAEVEQAMATVRSANPEAVVLVGPYNTLAAIVKKAHAQNWRPLFLTVSFVGTDEFIAEAGADAEGVVVTQVVPPYYLTDLHTVALYRRVLQKYYPNEKPNFVSLEGFVDALVLVEGLKRAGKNPTREGLIRGIESIHEFDAGLGPSLRLNYSARDHKGFSHVIPTVVRSGRAVPITDWNDAVAK
ncbi:MAG TPA: ABC transporter substrate-binding protein, partial [Methylomirabilota bacterium]|nr:ABC transporter substrate-binding protein [Methylomirabilota bacterium]